jgi:hypothetical protein
MGAQLLKSIASAKSGYQKPKTDVQEQRQEAKYPRTAEPALIHPMNTSVIKVRDDGMIDLFVGTDNGIRIDPVTKSINIIGNSFQQYVDNINSQVVKSVVQKVGKDWTVETKGNVNIKAKGKVLVNTESSAEVTAKGKATVTSESDVIVTAKGKARIEAQGNIEAKASKIFATSTGELKIVAAADLTLQTSGKLAIIAATVDLKASGTFSSNAGLYNFS